MKKFLPIILFLLGIGVFVATYFLFIKTRKSTIVEEEKFVPEIPFEQRPVVSLTPSEDGHWLKLEIVDIKVTNVDSMDYELLYRVSDGRTQGVPGTVSLDNETFLERDLLLGSESSGKFRYDEGVEKGTLTLRFRNDKGKLLGKLSTDFHLQSGIKALTTVDGEFSYSLDKIPRGTFFVVMETFGVPADLPGALSSGPYGIFTSGKNTYPGTIEMGEGNYYRWTRGGWEELKLGKSSDVGIFVICKNF